MYNLVGGIRLNERLWAPWRLEYIQNAGQQEGCIFCMKPAEENDAGNLILHRGETAFVILNLFPYTTGHMMVAPYRHTADPGELENAERLEMWHLMDLGMRALKKAYAPHGFNAGMNLGRVAGAGIPDHMHLHIVPRWGGDTNFIPVLTGVRVIPELLQDTYQKLKAILLEELQSE